MSNRPLITITDFFSKVTKDTNFDIPAQNEVKIAPIEKMDSESKVQIQTYQLGLDTSLLLYSGEFVLVRDLQENSILMGNHSIPLKIIPGSIQRKRGKMYQIDPKNEGMSTWTCSENQILNLRINNAPRAHAKDGVWYAQYHTMVNGLPKEVAFQENGNYKKFKCKEEAQEFVKILEHQPFEWQISIQKMLTLPKHSVGRYYSLLFQPHVIQLKAPSKTLASSIREFWGNHVTEEQILTTAWVLGMWLTDGSAGRPEITQIQEDIHNPEHSHTSIVDRLVDWRNSMNVPKNRSDFVKVTKIGSSGNSCYSIYFGQSKRKVDGTTQGRLSELLKSYGIYYEKAIPLDLLRESEEIRLNVLGGIIDGDAFFESLKKDYEISAKMLHFAQGLSDLAKGLGFRVGKIATKICRTKEGKEFSGYRLHISGDLHALSPYIVLKYKRCGTKEERGRILTRDGTCTGFKIEETNEEEFVEFSIQENCQCISRDFLVI